MSNESNFKAAFARLTAEAQKMFDAPVKLSITTQDDIPFIIKVVCSVLNVPVDTLQGDKIRSRAMLVPRYIAIYMCSHYGGYRAEPIGEYLELDPRRINKAIRKMKVWVSVNDPTIVPLVSLCEDALFNPSQFIESKPAPDGQPSLK